MDEMRQCPDYLYEYMQEFLDGDIPAEHDRVLKEHLRTCKDCRDYFYELKRTEMFIKSLANVHAPDGFTDEVLNRLPKAAKKARLRHWFSHHPFLTAAAIFLLLMSGSTFSAWADNHEDFSVTKQPDLIIKNDTAIVPEGKTINGDIVVRNGSIRIEGKVDGDVTVINGEKYIASAGEVTGDIQEINQLFEWIWFDIKNKVSQWIKIFDGKSEEEKDFQ